MKKMIQMDNGFTLKQLNINGAYLYDVIWDRMSLTTLKQEEALEAYNRAQVATLEQEKEDTTVEEGKTSEVKRERARTVLDVLVETVEHLEITTSEGTGYILDDKSSAVRRFESLMTQPDDVEWRIFAVF
ncbi:unnamed protein product [Peronospora belbahrii]|uniref:Uncharacterized protein n=1 Tax=Peronospora belbahrii TaxID=622444 RepID=A0AAU9KPL4_9STRA|nr:unnamed protein product [Peronospora belbahrii]